MGLVAELLREQQLPTQGERAQRLQQARSQLAVAFRRQPLSAPVERQLLAELLHRLLTVENVKAPAGLAPEASHGVPPLAEPSPPRELSELKARLTEQWLGHVLNIWRRLEQDSERLSSHLGVALGPPRSVHLALGDRHCGGQSVTELTFDGGVSLIYKPRPVALEAFFTRLLRLLGSDALSFRGLDVVAGDGYGWVRKLAPQACATPAEIARFHERLGGLLAIAYAFGATDLHEDNLIAVGEHPVLIDLETLISTELPGAETADQPEYSVLDVGLLPAWLPDEAGLPVLSGGMGGGWLARGCFGDAPLAHVPRLGSQLVSPLAHAADVARGFEFTSQRLVQQQDEVLALSQSIRHAAYRRVLRPTRHYTRALRLALHGSEQRGEGLLEQLTRYLPPFRRDDGSGRVFEAELSSLTTLDVPYFSGTLARASLCALDDHEVLHLPSAPWDILERRLTQLGEHDFRRQAQQVRAVFAAAQGQQSAEQPSAAEWAGSTSAQPEAPPLSLACAIAAELEASACRTADGGATWLRPRHWPEAGVWQVGRTDIDFATGRAGLAVFFSALARCTGQARRRSLAEACLSWQQPLLTQLKANPVDVPPGPYGALLYGLVLSGQLLGSREPLLTARELALLVPEPAERVDLSLWTGAAGLVLGLVAVAESTTDPGLSRELLDRAERVARHLTAQSREESPLLGFGYGVDGWRFALRRLTAALARAGREPAPPLEEPPFWHDGLDASVAPLLPPCPTAEHDAEHGSCSGRLGREVVAALTERGAPPPALLLEEGEAPLDLLCCGNAGLIDLSLELGQHWPALRGETERRAARLQTRASTNAGYRLRLSPDLQRPGLFDGLAGIGYMWLRLHDPRLPCLLLWNTLSP